MKISKWKDPGLAFVQGVGFFSFLFVCLFFGVFFFPETTAYNP